MLQEVTAEQDAHYYTGHIGKSVREYPTVWCRLDPNCIKHPWHAGHGGPIPLSDPRVLYAARLHKRKAGKYAWEMVAAWKPVEERGDTSYMLFVFVYTALMTFPLRDDQHLASRVIDEWKKYWCKSLSDADRDALIAALEQTCKKHFSNVQ